MDYIQVLVKIAIGAVMIILYTRLTGRSQLAPLSVSDVVSSIVIGTLVSESVLNDDVSTPGLLGIVFFWSALMLLLRFVKSRRIAAELLLDGDAVQLVKDGRLLPHHFRSVKLTVRDFETLIHQSGIAGLDDLQDVWFEPNGQLSVVKKGEDMHSVLVIEDGQVYKGNLARLGRDEGWLHGQLAQQGVEDIKTVFCAEWHDQKLWVYRWPE